MALEPTSSSAVQTDIKLWLSNEAEKMWARSRSHSALWFILGWQLRQLLCFPPTCLLDGQCTSTSGQRSYRGDSCLPSIHIWLMNQKDPCSLQAESEEDWLQHRKKSKEWSAFNTRLPYRSESMGNIFHHLKNRCWVRAESGLLLFHLFPDAFHILETELCYMESIIRSSCRHSSH